MDFTVPGIIAHESAMGDGNWRDVPVFDWPMDGVWSNGSLLCVCGSS